MFHQTARARCHGSVHVHRVHLILTRQYEGKAPVFHQRNAFTVFIAQRIEAAPALSHDLFAYLFRQILCFDPAHINDGRTRLRKICKFRIHPLSPHSALLDLDALHDLLWRGPLKIHMQQTVFQPRTSHFNTIGHNERALKLPRGNTLMQENPLRIIFLLLPPHHQLPAFNGDRKIGLRKTGYGKRDAVAVFAGLLDIERRVASRIGFGCAFHQPFEPVKSQQQRVAAQRNLGHRVCPCIKRQSKNGPETAATTPNMGAFREIARFSRCHFLGVIVLWRYFRATGTSESGARGMNKSAEMGHQEVLRVKLEVLRREHRDLDEAIHALQESRRADQLRLRRLKKQKLALKDQITQIEDELTPDIIA